MYILKDLETTSSVSILIKLFGLILFLMKSSYGDTSCVQTGYGKKKASSLVEQHYLVNNCNREMRIYYCNDNDESCNNDDTSCSRRLCSKNQLRSISKSLKPNKKHFLRLKSFPSNAHITIGICPNRGKGDSEIAAKASAVRYPDGTYMCFLNKNEHVNDTVIKFACKTKIANIMLVKQKNRIIPTNNLRYKNLGTGTEFIITKYSNFEELGKSICGNNNIDKNFRKFLKYEKKFIKQMNEFYKKQKRLEYYQKSAHF